MPASTCVTMKTVAGQPIKRPCCPGKLQNPFHQFQIFFAESLLKLRLLIRPASTLVPTRGSAALVDTLSWPKALAILYPLPNEVRPARSPRVSQLVGWARFCQ
jgi:hypothetical protein